MTEAHRRDEDGEVINDATEVTRGWFGRTKDNLVRWFGHSSFLFAGEYLAFFGANLIPCAPLRGVVTNLAGTAISGQGAKNSSWGEKAWYTITHIAATAAPLAFSLHLVNPWLIPITGGLAFGAAAITMRNRLNHR